MLRRNIFIGSLVIVAFVMGTVILSKEFNITSQKEIIQNHEKDWINFKYHSNDLRVYFDYLINFSCIIKEVRYGINDSLPVNLYVIPSCESIKDGNTLDLEIYRIIPPSTKKMSILLKFIDDSESDIGFYNVEVID